MPSPTVLVIDDSLDATDALEMLLERLGYRVFVAHDGLTGLTTARMVVPDLVVLDFAMPGLNGAQVGRQLRSDRPDAKILMSSGTPETVVMDEFDEYDAFIAKPVDFDSLPAQLRKLIGPGTAGFGA